MVIVFMMAVWLSPVGMGSGNGTQRTGSGGKPSSPKLFLSCVGFHSGRRFLVHAALLLLSNSSVLPYPPWNRRSLMVHSMSVLLFFARTVSTCPVIRRICLRSWSLVPTHLRWRHHPSRESGAASTPCCAVQNHFLR